MDNKIKLVIADIDGTLLNSRLILTQRTRNALRALKKQGIPFCIASGRTPAALLKNLVKWDIADACDYIIGFNGGAIYNTVTHETIEGPQLAGSVIDEILEDFQGFEFNAGIHGRQYFHSLKDDEVARMIAQIDCLTLSVDDLSYYKQRTCHKLVLHSSAEVIDQMMAYAESLKKTNYTPIRTADIIIECIPPQISKAKAIQTLAKQLHLESDQVLTFGDMMNDYEMIRDYVGVAMANADPRLQSCAKYITKSNDEDGVAVFIENLLA